MREEGGREGFETWTGPAGADTDLGRGEAVARVGSGEDVARVGREGGREGGDRQRQGLIHPSSSFNSYPPSFLPPSSLPFIASPPPPPPAAAARRRAGRKRSGNRKRRRSWSTGATQAPSWPWLGITSTDRYHGPASFPPSLPASFHHRPFTLPPSPPPSFPSSLPQVLASGSADATVKLWDVTTGQCSSTYTHHSDKVASLEWHPVEGIPFLSFLPTSLPSSLPPSLFG